MLGYHSDDGSFSSRQWKKVTSSYRNAWLIAAFIYLTLPLPMWWLNVAAESSGWVYLNLIPTILGTIAIFFWGLRPTHILAFGGIGGLMEKLRDKDTSQGVAIGPYWLYRAVLWFGFGFFMIGITLTTWSFHEAPGAFWIGYGSLLGLVIVFQLLRWNGTWAPYIALIYLLGCLAVSAWQTFGYEDVAHQELINENGLPDAMGYRVDGKFIAVDGKIPQDCKPTDAPFLYGPDGEMFNFAENNRAWMDRHSHDKWSNKTRTTWAHDEDGDGVFERTVYRPADGCWHNGIPLEPATPEDAPELGRFHPSTIVDWVTETPAEKAAREKHEAEEAARKKAAGSAGGAGRQAPTSTVPARPPYLKGYLGSFNAGSKITFRIKANESFEYDAGRNTCSGSPTWRDLGIVKDPKTLRRHGGPKPYEREITLEFFGPKDDMYGKPCVINP